MIKINSAVREDTKMTSQNNRTCIGNRRNIIEIHVFLWVLTLKLIPFKPGTRRRRGSASCCSQRDRGHGGTERRHRPA